MFREIYNGTVYTTVILKKVQNRYYCICSFGCKEAKVKHGQQTAMQIQGVMMIRHWTNGLSFTVTFDSDTTVAVSKKNEDLNKPKQRMQFVYGRSKF
jgi:hypothetical protein